jgi:protein involved in polysaccharide export with SLBB domain
VRCWQQIACSCLGFVAIALLALGACTGLDSNAIPTADSSGSTTQLRVAAGDKLRVTVFGEDKLSGEYQIDNAGALSLPLAGTITAAGLTKAELEQELTKQLKSQYLRNPKVTVDVVSFRPFYVLGEVTRPGEYQFRSGLNVLSAIAVAGGVTYRAHNSTVYIQRSGSTAFTEYSQSPNVMVMPGDVVRVPERFF